MTDYCILLDAWEEQPLTNMQDLHANGIAGVLLRLNDMNGGHHMDTNFVAQWQEAQAVTGLLRAPYFVYNPWVNGQANFDWFFAHCPADAKTIAVDVEIAYSGISRAQYAADVNTFMTLARAHWHTLVYTGQWFMQYLSSWPLAEYWWAQYPLSMYPSSAQQWSWAQLKAAMDALTVPSNSNTIPGALGLWQCSGDRIILPGQSHPVDVNLYRGTFAELCAYWGEPVPPDNPPADPDELHTEPYNGVAYHRVKRFGTWAHVVRVSPAAHARFHVTKFALKQVSTEARELGAQIVTNGGDFNQTSAVGLHYSEGVRYAPQSQYEPFLNLTAQQAVGVEPFNSGAAPFNALAGKRFLVINGQVSTATSAAWAERHPRTLAGVTADGSLLLIVVDGRRVIDDVYTDGVDLYEGAQLGIEFGAMRLIDLDGGGSSDMYIDGRVVNVPSDGAERYVGTRIAIFIPTEGNVTEYRYRASSPYSRAIRNGHAVTFSNIGSIPSGEIAYGDELFTATVDVYSAGVKVQKAGDVWLHVKQIGTQAVDAWTAIIHLGATQMTIVDAGAPPQPTGKTIKQAVITFDDGTTETLVPQA